MAELATIARPYAEALFKAVSANAAVNVAAQVKALAAVAGHPQMRSFADNPKAGPQQVFDLVTGVAGVNLSEAVRNLLLTVIDNGRLAALPEIAAQFQALMNLRSGVSDALIESAFAIDDEQLRDVKAALERRFARRLNVRVQLDPSLIGGIRVVVGDEVLDTSVKARLEQMKVALTA
jgi:F-type H+-transporting ATPase subunit delta